jgi:peptidoglycan/LPS O-acetylase OafA/YrhL
MGTLRLLLAVAVVLAHIAGIRYVITGGETSVQCFYMISGFFIAMILDQKYNKKGDLKLFYSNRFIRIFSVYWVFLLIAFCLAILARFATHHGTVELWLQNWKRIGAPGLIFLVLSNVFLFGQDWTLFMKMTAHGLQWATNFQESAPWIASLLFVPPAWSLGIELTFYSVAPLISRLRWWMIGVLIVASCVLRFVFHLHGLDRDPWSYRFFPFEIALFLSGTLSYRIYKSIKGRDLATPCKVVGIAIFPLLLAFPLYDHSDGMFFAYGRILLYTYLVFALPILFSLTGRMKLDRTLGELSYPLYLCHPIVLAIIGHLSKSIAHFWLQVILSLGLSLGLAYLTAKCLDEPIDRFRQLRVKRSRNLTSDAPIELQLNRIPAALSQISIEDVNGAN